MDQTRLKLMALLNETLIPFAIRALRSATHLEFSRESMQLLNQDAIYSHPHIRCSCGSDKVFNYGLPRNNGVYFFCRTCENSFTVQAGSRPEKPEQARCQV